MEYLTCRVRAAIRRRQKGVDTWTVPDLAGDADGTARIGDPGSQVVGALVVRHARVVVCSARAKWALAVRGLAT
jgi:hypothetical protein